jgi:hypothetical protein
MNHLWKKVSHKPQKVIYRATIRPFATMSIMKEEDVIDPSISMKHHKCAWRQDPQYSYSDWKIEVSLLDDELENGEEALIEATSIIGKTKTYHVHKFFLGVGPRKSTYFDGLFKLDMIEAESCKTCLHLETSAASAFPAFLDYVYSGELSLPFESAVALGYLGDYFGVAPLKPLVDGFIDHDMQESRNHVHIYCQEASIYRDSVLVESLMKKVALLSPEDLLLSVSNEGSSSSDSPVQKMMTMLSKDQRNQIYFDALQAAHAELARFKQVKDYNSNVYINRSYQPDSIPVIKECSKTGAAIRADHNGNNWFPLFFYDSRQ